MSYNGIGALYGNNQVNLYQLSSTYNGLLDEIGSLSMQLLIGHELQVSKLK